MWLAGERCHSQPARSALPPSRLGCSPLGAALPGASRTERNTYTMTSEEISVAIPWRTKRCFPAAPEIEIGTGWPDLRRWCLSECLVTSFSELRRLSGCRDGKVLKERAKVLKHRGHQHQSFGRAD
jgi:hypothetical protein